MAIIRTVGFVQSLHNPFNGRANALSGIKIPVDQSMSLENPLKVRQRVILRPV